MARFVLVMFLVADVLYRFVTDFGAGPALDENFDFAIDRRGDIKVVNGFDELSKDISLTIAETIENSGGLGAGSAGSFEEDVRVDVGVAISRDPRVESVNQINVSEDEENRNELNVAISLQTTQGPFEDVIPVQL